MIKTASLARGVLVCCIIATVFLTGCTSASGAGSCSGPSAQGWSGVVPFKQVLCFGSMEGHVIALDPVARSDNKTYPTENEWAYTIKTATPGAACGAMCGPSTSASSMGIYATPVTSGDLVYEGTYSGKLYALNGNRGVVRWVYPREGYETVGGVVGNIISDGQSVFFGSSNGKLYALDALTGDFKWEFQTSNKIWTSPALDNGVVYIGNYGGNIYALSAESGKAIWEIKIPSAVASSIVVSGGNLYFGTFDRYLHALDKANGQEKWKVQGGNWFWAAPVIKDGVVYAACLDRKVYALEADSGKEIWQFSTESP
ncbi:MAG: PQQ-binding-like beta-propeller repeat protein, partial [Chloroflexi bacterium]|nr:PQQ-binding-like beta-propeller repeat protein [Chloroflexota bacterium]